MRDNRTAKKHCRYVGFAHVMDKFTDSPRISLSTGEMIMLFNNDICFVSTQSNWVSDSRMITVKYRKRKKKAANWPSSSLCIGHTCFLTALSVCDLINIE